MRTLVGPAVRLATALAALALVAAGLFLVVEIVAALVGADPVLLPDDWVADLRGVSWDDPEVARWLWLLTAVGVLLLAVGLWPRPPLTVPTDRPGYRVERRSLESTVQDRLAAIDGVDQARVRMTRRRLRARLSGSRPLDASGTHRQAADAVYDVEERFGVAAPAEVRLTGGAER